MAGGIKWAIGWLRTMARSWALTVIRRAVYHRQAVVRRCGRGDYYSAQFRIARSGDESMKFELKQLVGALALAGLAASSEACVYAPDNGEWIAPGTPVVFKGYAEQQNKTVRIYAKNQQTSAWVQVGTATSSSSGTTYYG